MVLDRKYVIAAAVAAFISWALLTDWLPSLRWIPHAFLAGILATVLGLTFLITTTSRGVQDAGYGRRRAVVPRPGFTAPEHWEEEKAALKGRLEYRRPGIFPTAIGFSKAVDTLLDVILRDYVTSWYSGVTKRQAFQHEIDRCIRSVLLTIAARFSNLDVVELGVSRVLPIVTSHLRDFYDAEHVVRGKTLSHNVTESEELDTAIATKYRNGKLHSVASLAYADTTTARQAYLRSVIAKLLPTVLPDTMRTSPSVLVLIKEIVSYAVLGPVFQMLLDPDTWNQLIVNFGGPMLRDRKTVRKLRAALDQHAPVSPKASKAAQYPRLRPYDNERQFERFIRAIRHAPTATDARRFRSEIMSQLRRESLIEGQDAAYLRRLETGKRLLDQKITSFGTESAARPKLAVQLPAAQVNETAARKRQASLRDLLTDASGLSYFMEYMDRLKLMRLVQFWLVVDGFRGPLEGDADEPAPAGVNASDRMDIAQMYEAYLSKPELQTSDIATKAVRHCLKLGPRADQQDYFRARRAVLQTQTEAYNRMKEVHYENFKSSDLYYKWLAIDDHSGRAASTTALSPISPANSTTSPVKGRKAQLMAPNREPELRRAVLSTSDLRTASSKSVNALADSRRSMDDNGIRPSLFGDDEIEDERMTQSISSLRSYDSDGEAAQEAQSQAQAVSAMQLALDDIVGDEEDRTSLFSEPTRRPSLDVDAQSRTSEQRGSIETPRPELLSKASDGSRPSLAALGLVGGPSNHGVFVDDLFSHEAKHFSEDEREDSNGPEESDDDKVQEAAPGDLGLTEAIDSLSGEIEKLRAQKNIVDSLSAKAELTNNSAELRILRKSEQSLQREMKRKEMQRQQYMVQESDNSLYGRAAVSIKSVMVGREDDGHEFALYVIEVERQAGDQLPAATWAVTRRYSQFHDLHKRLRAHFPAVRELNFPRRQTLFTLQKDFLQKRRTILERYLRSLLLVPAICRSRELRAFLSQAAISSNGSNGTQLDARDFVTRIYSSVSDGMEELLGNIPVLDQLSVAGQNLISAASAQSNGSAIDSLDPAVQDPATSAEAEAELNAFETKEMEPFVKPICDLFLETFELSKGNSWLRGRTVVIILHQLLGGTIERRVREAADNALEDESLARYVNFLRETMWPDGKLRPPGVQRTVAEKARTRKEASLLLGMLIPDMAGSVVGKANAQAASRKIMAMLNNQRLNTHIVFTLIDEIMKLIFPDVMDR